VGDRLAYGDEVAPLEAAALAVSRLAPRSPVIRRCRSGRSEANSARRVVMPRRMVAGSRRVDLHRLAAFPHGLPLRVGATLSLAERGGDIAALAVELHSWIVQPDPRQRDLLDSGFAHLRQAGPRSAPPCPFTSGSVVPRASRLRR
jgi:hypothetical protein